MDNIFIFQIRRIGDFFQSIPLINGLYKKNQDGNVPGKIDIAIDESLTDIKRLFNDNIKLHTLEELTSAGNTDPSLDNFNPSLFFNFLDNYRPYISKFLKKYNLAVNLNHDIKTSLFMDFFDDAEKKGFISINKSEKPSDAILRKGAPNYLYNSIKNRSLNKINIVDIFSFIGLGMPAEIKKKYEAFNPEYLNLDKKRIKKTPKSNRKFRICISPGASSIKRVWHPESYARLIELLLKNINSEIVIVGAAGETGIAAEIKKYVPLEIAHMVLDITGKTSPSEIIYLLKDFDLIVSADTGTLHISQVLNVPAVSVFIGNSNFYETGPHLKNSYVIYSKAECYPCLENEPCRYNFGCKRDVNPQDVFHLAEMILDGTKNKAAAKIISGNIKKGNFEAAVCKHIGSIHYFPLVKKEIGKNELASEILKFSWIYVLSDVAVNPDLNRILQYTKKYYKNSKKAAVILISEITFIKSVFENGKKCFARSEGYKGEYFKKFAESVKSLGYNYGYLKLAVDYFIDEAVIPDAGYSEKHKLKILSKAFNDIILLLDTALEILGRL